MLPHATLPTIDLPHSEDCSSCCALHIETFIEESAEETNWQLDKLYLLMLGAVVCTTA